MPIIRHAPSLLVRLGAAVAVAGAVLALIIPFYLMHINMHPARMDGTTPNPDVFHWPYERLQLAAEDGVPIIAWLVRGDTGAPVVVMVHGLGGSKSGMLHFAEIAHKQGYHVLLPDLRGHGESGDAATTFGFNEVLDIKIAIHALERRTGIDTSRIGVMAQSMGCAPAIGALAGHPRVKGFFLDSPFDALDRTIVSTGLAQYPIPEFVAKAALPVYRLLAGTAAENVNPAGILSRVNLPVFVIHGNNDRTIPTERGRALFAAACGRKAMLEVDGEHAEAWGRDPGRYEKLMGDFFRGILSDTSFDPATLVAPTTTAERKIESVRAPSS